MSIKLFAIALTFANISANLVKNIQCTVVDNGDSLFCTVETDGIKHSSKQKDAYSVDLLKERLSLVIFEYGSVAPKSITLKELEVELEEFGVKPVYYSFKITLNSNAEIKMIYKDDEVEKESSVFTTAHGKIRRLPPRRLSLWKIRRNITKNIGLSRRR